MLPMILQLIQWEGSDKLVTCFGFLFKIPTWKTQVLL